MKKVLPFLFVLIGFGSVAQIVNIPDPNFKNALINYQRTVDTNGDGEIQYSEAASFSGSWGLLFIDNKNISDLTGIQAFTYLKQLSIMGNHLTTLDLSGMSFLTQLTCSSNNLTSINITGCTSLYWLACFQNQLTSLNLAGLTSLANLTCFNNNITSLDISLVPALRVLACDHNQLTSIDISQNPLLTRLNCSSNPLTSLNVKNGAVFNYTNGYQNFESSGNPVLQYVCADNGEVLFLLNYFVQHGMPNVQVDTNCSFSTSGGYGTVNGIARLDLDNNGCGPSDNGKSLMPLKLINDSDTLQNFFTKADSSGAYTVHTYAGNYSLTPQFQLPYYIITPDTIHFTTAPGTTQNLNFCIAPDGLHNDLDITINYIAAFIDGTCEAMITYKNKGTEAMSGDVKYNFDDNKLNFISASEPLNNQATGVLTWNFSNLQPFETRSIYISLYLLPAPVNNINDTLTFTANVNTVAVDETPSDNIFTFRAPVTYSVLPISIEYFKGSIQSGNHFLNWKVTCTSLEAKFSIERSIDGRNYNSLGNITASNTRCLQPFDFTDNNPAAGMNYYRIKMTDVDGKVTYSSVIALLNKETGFEIVTLSPNPVIAGAASLNVTAAEKQTIHIKVSDASGKIVQSLDQPVISGFTNINMNFSNLAAGIYTIAVYTNEGEIKTKQFIKQ